MNFYSYAMVVLRKSAICNSLLGHAALNAWCFGRLSGAEIGSNRGRQQLVAVLDQYSDPKTIPEAEGYVFLKSGRVAVWLPAANV